MSMALIVIVSLLALWNLINAFVCIVVWINGGLLRADKQIVSYMIIVSLFSTAGFAISAVTIAKMAGYLENS